MLDCRAIITWGQEYHRQGRIEVRGRHVGNERGKGRGRYRQCVDSRGLLRVESRDHEGRHEEEAGAHIMMIVSMASFCHIYYIAK